MDESEYRGLLVIEYCDYSVGVMAHEMHKQ
jgi:hypothetical protein